jgi:hypothetical protein
MLTLWSSTRGQPLPGRGVGVAACVDAGAGFAVGALPGWSSVCPGAEADEPAAADSVGVGAGAGSAAGTADGVVAGVTTTTRAGAVGVGVAVSVGDGAAGA